MDMVRATCDAGYGGASIPRTDTPRIGDFGDTNPEYGGDFGGEPGDALETCAHAEVEYIDRILPADDTLETYANAGNIRWRALTENPTSFVCVRERKRRGVDRCT